MATEVPFALRLAADDWTVVLSAVEDVERRLGQDPSLAGSQNEPDVEELIVALVRLATHSKWEIRRAVANAAAQALHPAFEEAIAKLLVDPNARVRHAAERAALRRRDWHNASLLGRQHEERINATLDDIEARFGLRGRDAVKRASTQIANTFARELYHEVVKLLSPIAVSVERFHQKVSKDANSAPELAEETARMGRRLTHLRAVLDSMRAYTDSPRLTFEALPLKEIVEEAVALIRERERKEPSPGFLVEGEADVVVNVARSRFLQVLANLFANAVESYDGQTGKKAPIRVRWQVRNEHIELVIQDAGCGMSDEVLKDAPILFATSKVEGTGFGLPLAIKIVESEHGGRVTLESKKAKGTTVRILLPTAHSRAAR